MIIQFLLIEYDLSKGHRHILAIIGIDHVHSHILAGLCICANFMRHCINDLRIVLEQLYIIEIACEDILLHLFYFLAHFNHSVIATPCIFVIYIEVELPVILCKLFAAAPLTYFA